VNIVLRLRYAATPPFTIVFLKMNALGVPVHLLSIALYGVGGLYFVVCEIGNEFL
jgi:hypothetical protein